MSAAGYSGERDREVGKNKVLSAWVALAASFAIP